MMICDRLEEDGDSSSSSLIWQALSQMQPAGIKLALRLLQPPAMIPFLNADQQQSTNTSSFVTFDGATIAAGASSEEGAGGGVFADAHIVSSILPTFSRLNISAWGKHFASMSSPHQQSRSRQTPSLDRLFDLRCCIGRGHSSDVFLAMELDEVGRPTRPVAVKRISLQLRVLSKQNDEQHTFERAIRRIINEASLLRDISGERHRTAISHNAYSLLALRGVFQDAWSVYIVTDLVDGSTLRQRIADEVFALSSGQCQCLPPSCHDNHLLASHFHADKFFSEIRFIVSSVLRSVVHLLEVHHVAHRDLKLENVMVESSSSRRRHQSATASDGDGGDEHHRHNCHHSSAPRLHVVVLDYGLAKVLPAAEQQQPSNNGDENKEDDEAPLTPLVGTLQYIPYESVALWAAEMNRRRCGSTNDSTSSAEARPPSHASAQSLRMRAHKADVYGAGVILYALLYRRLPYQQRGGHSAVLSLPFRDQLSHVHTEMTSHNAHVPSTATVVVRQSSGVRDGGWIALENVTVPQDLLCAVTAMLRHSIDERPTAVEALSMLQLHNHLNHHT